MKVTIIFNRLAHHDVKNLYDKIREFDAEIGHSGQYKFEISTKEDKE